MKAEIHSHLGPQKMPETQVFNLLDNQLLVFVRGWGSQDFNKKFIDEISHYLSSAQADIEVTSPFDFLENQSSLANKVRIALLLAHDYFYKSENKSSFSVGFEAAVFMRHKKELAWGAIGRFDIYRTKDDHLSLLSAVGTDRDSEVLLPIDLLGVEKDVDIRLGSVLLAKEQIFVSSVYGSTSQYKINPQTKELDFSESDQEKTSYWLSKITLD